MLVIYAQIPEELSTLRNISAMREINTHLELFLESQLSVQRIPGDSSDQIKKWT